MASRRVVAVCGGLSAILAVGACGRADPQPGQRGSSRPLVTPATGSELAVERLRRALEAPPPLSAEARNPFRFGATARAAGAGASRGSLPPPDGLPQLPLPLAQPPLRLLGLITLTDGAKVAVFSVGSDLVLARTGDMLAGRFRVGRIGEDAVDVTDAVGQRSIRVALP